MSSGPHGTRVPSATELVILKLICKGLRTYEIGKRLGISPRTVEAHKNKLRIKLDASGVIQIIRNALKLKYISLEDLTRDATP